MNNLYVSKGTVLLVHRLVFEFHICCPTGPIRLSLGDQHSMILKQDCSLWSTDGISADKVPLDSKKSNRFVRIIRNGVKAMDVGKSYSVVLLHDESVWSTRKVPAESLGDKVTHLGGLLFFMQHIIGASVAVAGGHHSMVLTHYGRLWATGWNKYGQIGDGSTTDKSKFVAVSSTQGKAVMAMAAGDVHSIIMKKDGSVWSTGRNCNGQLGDGLTVDRSSFVKVMLNGAADVAAGDHHSMVLKLDGSVWTTGRNRHGQLGDGSTADRTIFVPVVSSGTKAVAAGSRHSLMLREDGSVWAAGYNLYGQLGDGSKVDNPGFVQAIFDSVETIAAGAFHSMVIKQDGTFWATGSNEHGQFGDGTTKSQKAFVQLALFDDGLAHNTINTHV